MSKVNRIRPAKTVTPAWISADAVLALIPISFLALCLVISRSGFYPIFSNPLGYDQDPAYVYLYSGLALLHGKIPQHVDHPGTSYQVFLSAVILLGFVANSIGFESLSWSSLRSLEKLDSFVFTFSEPILITSGVIMCLLISLLSFLLAKNIYRFTGSMAASIVSQMFLFSWASGSPTIPITLFTAGPNLIPMRAIYPAPESLLILLALAGLLLLTKYVEESLVAVDVRVENKNRYNAPLIGIITALGLFAKITFIPFVPLIFVIRGNELKTALKFFVGSSLLMSVVIFKRIPYLTSWLYRNATHVGPYGSGSAGLVDGSNWSSFLKFLSFEYTFAWAPFLIILIMLFVKGLGRRGGYKRPRFLGRNPSYESSVLMYPSAAQPPACVHQPAIRTYSLFAASLTIGLFMLFKNPSSHYFTASIVVLYYTLSVSIGMLESIALSRFKPVGHLEYPRKDFVLIARLGFPVIVGISTIAIISAFALMPNFVKANRSDLTQALPVNISSLPRDQIYCSYRVPTKSCSVAFALSYNSQISGSSVYSGLKYYNIWTNGFSDYGPGGGNEVALEGKPRKNFSIIIDKSHLALVKKSFDSNHISLASIGDHYELWQSER